MADASGSGDIPAASDEEIVASPAGGVTDTANTAMGPVAPGVVEATSYVAAQAAGPDGLSHLGYYRETLHFGPLPPPEMLRELVEVYPEAARGIFAEFKAQGKHRRAHEAKRIDAGIELARRGQIIAAWLGTLGIGGGILVGAVGHPAWGFAAVVTSVVSLVSVFLYRADKQQKNLAGKRRIREAVGSGQPIEKIEDAEADGA